MKSSLTLIVAVLLLFSHQMTNSQTQLQSGDIAIISVSSTVPKSFGFVCLTTVKSGTEVYFTDDAWIDSIQAFRGSEGVLKYTFPTDVAAGHTIVWEKDVTNFIGSGSFNLSTSGDNIICYQKTSTTTFIYGIGWAKNTKGNWSYLSSTSGATSTSDIPSGLNTSNFNLIYFGNADSYAFNESALHKGTKDAILAEIANPLNYISSDEVALSIADSKFIIDDDSQTVVTDPDEPEIDTAIKITDHNIEPDRVGACQFYNSGINTILFTDKTYDNVFDVFGWDESDTTLILPDSTAIILFAETSVLRTIIKNKTIETIDGEVATWYRDNETIETSEGVKLDSDGRYFGIVQSNNGCQLKSEEIIVFQTSVDSKSSFDTENLIYIDYLGRTFHTRPLSPHIAIPSKFGKSGESSNMY